MKKKIYNNYEYEVAYKLISNEVNKNEKFLYWPWSNYKKQMKDTDIKIIEFKRIEIFKEKYLERYEYQTKDNILFIVKISKEIIF